MRRPPSRTGDLVGPMTASAIDRLRRHADPFVWSQVSAAMRKVEARDSIVFRVGPVGRAWTIAAWVVGGFVGLRRLGSPRRPQ